MWLYPLKSKAANHVGERLFDFFSKVGTPKNMTTDEGSEFLGPVKGLLEQNNINHYTSLQKNRLGLINRYFRSLRFMMRQENDYNFVDNLQKYEDQINGEKHSYLRKTPSQLFNNPPQKPSKDKYPRVELPFEVGDVVLIKNTKKTFQSHYESKYDDQSYLIYGIRGQSYILLNIDNKNILDESFTADRLKKIDYRPDLLMKILDRKHIEKTTSNKQQELKQTIENENKQQRFMKKQDLD
jgi:ribosomal protein L21E